MCGHSSTLAQGIAVHWFGREQEPGKWLPPGKATVRQHSFPHSDCGHGCYRTRASACRSRTVPPITSAAEMMSRFLMMYCPSIVGA